MRGHIHKDKRTGSYWVVVNEVDSGNGGAGGSGRSG